MGIYRNHEKGELMHCFHFGPFGDNRTLLTSMQLMSALAVEQEKELQESRRRELEKLDVNRNEKTQRESGTTAPVKRNW